jgi:hypothetical protein
MVESRLGSHLVPRKIYVVLQLSIKEEVLDLARKANENNVAFSHIFLLCTVLYGEVQDMSLSRVRRSLPLHMKETQFAESLIRQLSRCPHLHRFLTQTGSRCGLVSLNSSF